MGDRDFCRTMTAHQVGVSIWRAMCDTNTSEEVLVKKLNEGRDRDFVDVAALRLVLLGASDLSLRMMADCFTAMGLQVSFGCWTLPVASEEPAQPQGASP